jgi:hypothetical protein
MTLFNKKKPDEKTLEPMARAPIDPLIPAPPAPVATSGPAFVTQREPRATLDRMCKLRQKKIDEANQLDREIHQLDVDITWLERHPGSVHTLEGIARRFAS